VSTEVQMYSCPRCQRGQFRAFPALNGKAFCPWCGDAVAPVAAPDASAADDPPLPELSLEELANRMSGGPAAPATITSAPTTVSTRPLPAAPAAPDLQARLAESERRREAAEAELRKELDKKAEIKKAVVAEVGRLEAELAEARDRVRRKDEEHASALQTLNVLTDSNKDEFNGDRMRMQQTIDEKDKALKSLEAKLEERKASDAELRKMMDASRAEVGKLHAEVAATQAERADLRKKVADFDLKLASLKDAPAQLTDLKKKLNDARVKSAGFEADVQRKDLRLKELQLLVKTLGERLNDLADRPR